MPDHTNRIIAITRILDEADIAEAFVRHTAAYVDHHILLDNGSSDATLDVLRALHAEGVPLTVYRMTSPHHAESDASTQLYRKAADAGADWVIPLDADEFIDDRILSFRPALGRIPPDIPLVRVMLTNYASTSTDDLAEPIAPVRMTRRNPPTDIPKVFVRGSLHKRDVRISDGNHNATIDGGAVCPWQDEPLIRLAHYPERSVWQRIGKVTKGWLKVEASGRSLVEGGAAYHYRGPFDHLRDHPELLLRGEWFNGFKDEHGGLIHDPINYRGGPLRYTPPPDEPMRAVRVLMGYAERLARQHGRLADEVPGARQALADWAAVWDKMV